MTSPLFSVIMPLYNHDQLVGHAIQSVLSQTFSDFELVICNDGSTDNSLAVAKSFSDRRIRIIEKPNGGTTSALNSCLLASRGELICWLSADDLYGKDKLLFHRYAYQEKGAQLSIAPFGYIIGTEVKPAQQALVSGPMRLVPFINHCYINGLSVCIARDLFTKVGPFDPRFKYAQDVDRWFEVISLTSPLYLSGEPQSYSRIGTGHLAENDANINGYLDHLKVLCFKLCMGLEYFLPRDLQHDLLHLEQLLTTILNNPQAPQNNMFYRFGMHSFFLKGVANLLKKHSFVTINLDDSTYALTPTERAELKTFVAGASDISQMDFYHQLDRLLVSPNVDQKIKDTIVFYKKTTLS
jgi:glycosyltransferase involved in cell wall biosynthesis